MSGSTPRQEAAASTRGTIYQLCVAVQKCYDLKPNQILLIEELGDITIEGEAQIEVKQYSDKLTDGHHNFWNTLKNWVDDRFDHTPYTSLVLHTTQQFGTNARIADWNSLDSEGRIELLRSIHSEFESNHEKAILKDSSRSPSAVLKHQRFILDPERREELLALIEKVWIEARTETLPELYKELKQDRARGILTSRKDDFLNSLIGYVCRADMSAGESWEISYENFDLKLDELTNTFRSETRVFPSKGIHDSNPTDIEDREDLFVKKIHDIHYQEAITTAVHHYEETLRTIDTEFSSHITEPLRLEQFSDTVEQRFILNYRKACRNCSEEINSSQDFYDDSLSSPPPDFPSFDSSPDWFRNGLLHISMNDSEKDYKWRLKKK